MQLVAPTFSDLQAWFLVYSASTRSGWSLESRMRGSRSELVLWRSRTEELLYLRSHHTTHRDIQGCPKRIINFIMQYSIDKKQNVPLIVARGVSVENRTDSCVVWAWLTWSLWRTPWSVSSSKATALLIWKPHMQTSHYPDRITHTLHFIQRHFNVLHNNKSIDKKNNDIVKSKKDNTTLIIHCNEFARLAGQLHLSKMQLNCGLTHVCRSLLMRSQRPSPVG